MQYDQWQHVAGTYDGTVTRVYLNGQLDGSLPIGQTLTDTSHIFQNTNIQNLHLGRNQDTASNFRGSLDEISLYKRALSSAEIQGIYQAGSDGKCSNP